MARLRERAYTYNMLYYTYLYIGNRIAGVAHVEINVHARYVQICPSPRWSTHIRPLLVLHNNINSRTIDIYDITMRYIIIML